MLHNNKDIVTDINEETIGNVESDNNANSVSSKNNNTISSTSKITVKSKKDSKFAYLRREEHERLKKCEDIVKRIEELINNKSDFSWCSSPLSRRFIGLSMTFVPSVSFFGASKMYMLLVYSFFHQIGVKINISTFSKMCPAKDVFKTGIKTVTAETLAVLRMKTKGKKLHYGCNAANKGGYHHIVKKIAWHDMDNAELCCIVLESDVCDSMDVDEVRFY